MAVLAPSEVTSKVVLVFALAATYVALERVFEAVTTHVDCVEYIVCKVHVTVLAVMEKLWVLDWEGRGRCARLAVAYARGAGSPATFAARPGDGATVSVIVAGASFGAGRRGAPRNAGGDGRSAGWCWRLLDHERFLVGARARVWGGGVMSVRR